MKLSDIFDAFANRTMLLTGCNIVTGFFKTLATPVILAVELTFRLEGLTLSAELVVDRFRG